RSDRRAAGHQRRRRREARHQHLHQARPPPDRGRPPPCAGGAALPGRRVRASTRTAMEPAPHTSKVVRRLWLALGSFFAISTLFFSGVWVTAAFARDTDTFQVTVDEPVARVVVDSDVGG